MFTASSAPGQPKPQGKQMTKGPSQIYKDNESTLKFYSKMIFVINSAVLAALVFLTWETWSNYCFIFHFAGLSVQLVCHRTMSRMAVATWNDRGQISDAGQDLNFAGGGMAEHLKDLIILTGAVQALAIISTWFWLLWLLVPSYAFYKLWTALIWPWISASSAAPQGGEDPATAKNRRGMRMVRAAR